MSVMMRSAALRCLCMMTLFVVWTRADGFGEDEGGLFLNFIQAASCPKWADCPSSGYTPVQAPYHAAVCAAGFGFVPAPHSKYYADDESYYSKSRGDYYEKHEGTCWPCKSGFWAPEGDGPCRVCGAGDGFFTPVGAGHIEDCMCLPGYGGPLCTECPANTFSPGGSYSTPRPACQVCPTGTQGSPAGSSSIDACGGCTAGRYLEPACTTCAGSSITCKLCPAHSVGSAAGSEGVESCGGCLAGWWFNTSCNTCKLCPTGTQGSADGAVGIGACGTCAAGFFYETSDDSCTPCPTGSTSAAGSVGIGSCQCAAGDYFDPLLNTCEQCPAGTQTTQAAGGVGVAACGPCVADYFLDTASNTCKHCPTGTNAAAGSVGVSACACPADHYLDAALGACQSCPAGSGALGGSTSINDCNFCAPGYGIVAESSDAERGCCGRPCAPCPFGFVSQGGSKVSCSQCPPGTQSATPTFCACTTPGYGVISGVCQKCFDGQYSQYNSGTGQNDCLACGTGFTTFGPGASSAAQCACAVGYGWNSATSTCEACSPPYYQGQLSPQPSAPGIQDAIGMPVTTATPTNPHPICVACSNRLGDPQKNCLALNAATGIGAYCVIGDGGAHPVCQ